MLKRIVRTWRRDGDSNPRNRFSGLHDFQSCSFGQLGHLSNINIYHYIIYLFKNQGGKINLFGNILWPKGRRKSKFYLILKIYFSNKSQMDLFCKFIARRPLGHSILSRTGDIDNLLNLC